MKISAGESPDWGIGLIFQQDYDSKHFSGGYTMIPPNESRRSQIKTMAQKEEEELKRWRETHRPPAVHLNPERLGGNVTLAEARQKQFVDSRSTKLQKKLKKEEMDKKKRQEEEEELQSMKARQREKSERLQEKRQQEDQKRSAQFQQDRNRKTESFLQSIETRAAGPSSSAAHTSSRSEDVEKLSKSLKDVQLEHKRVNAAFLDRLQGQNRGNEETKKESIQEDERPRLVSDDFSSWTKAGQVSLTHLQAGPEQSCSACTEETDPDPDYDWALMKLMNSFPDCSKTFLEEILYQCNGEYEQAYTLLITTFS
ncbi:epithelial-stromal interaction protein 1 isoform X2 [Melanotaenia boesemani]|uniref:epithelial-stromal interaction protein 1 isoform X2 n=1 Tax=Melanotaenia boesemani TaxID=1250792 RepID=UPI001C03F4DD|nr:epithelial-stromal interaction protein 1 isoform X2 [Melanotaenia boesemani]